MTSYLPKHILDMGKPIKKTTAHSCNSKGSTCSNLEKAEHLKDVTEECGDRPTLDEDLSQESQTHGLSASSTGALEISGSADRSDMVWNPSDNSSSNAVPTTDAVQVACRESTEVTSYENVPGIALVCCTWRSVWSLFCIS